MKVSSTRLVTFGVAVVALLATAGLLLQAEPPQAVGTWVSAGAVSQARSGAAAVALPDGRTLIAGGLTSDGGATESVVIYDPTTNAFSAAGQLLAARAGHSATLLSGGRVLIAGGTVDGAASADLEVFDVSSGTSTLVGQMAQARSGHAAAALADGKVVIVGGWTTAGAALASAELFDGGSATPLPYGLQQARGGASATTLIDGRVLVAGGRSGADDLGSAEIFDPYSQTFTTVGTQMSVARSGHTAVLLPHNNSVLIAGGTSGENVVGASDLFLPAEFPDPYSYGTGSFAATASLIAARSGAVGGPAGADGYAFVSGGGVADAEVYRFATIKTDKDDYAPGERAVITGSGWQPGEKVTLLFQEDPAVHADYVLEVTADASGNIYWDQWAPEAHDLNVRFYLLARDSRSRAQTTFTDGNMTVSGIVTDSATGLPISGALVECVAGCNPSPTATTASDGTYGFKPEYPGGGGASIQIRASKSGYTPQTKTATTAANGQTVTVNFSLTPSDAIAPVVSSIARVGANPTNAASVQWTVQFSEAVTGVNAPDFTLVNVGLGGTPAITGVTPVDADTYTVTASTGTGDGTLGLNLADDDTIADTAGNKLGGTGVGNGNFTGEVYTIDRTPPTVTSINRADANPTNAGSVNWTVQFSEAVTGVNAADFALANGGLGGTPAITAVTPVDGDTYTVTASTGTGDGTLGLNLVDDDSIADTATNKLKGTGTTGTADGSFTGEVYTIDRTPPVVSSIARAGANPTNASSVQWNVVFSESVTGVDATDFALAVGAGLSGTSITGVSGSGASYTVTANTGSGDGTLGLNLVDDDSIADTATNKLKGTGTTGTADGSFTGEVYTIDRTPPVVSSISRAGANPTNASSVQWTVTFSEAVTGVDTGDFALAVGAGLSGTSITGVSGSGASYTVTANTGAGDGTLGLNLVDDDSIADTATNKLKGTGTTGTADGSFTGEVYTIDRTPPVVSSIARAGANPTNASSVQWTVTFSEAVTGVDTGDFALAVGAGLSGTSITGVSGSGASYTVTANTGAGDGTLGLNLVDNDSIADAATNKLGGTGTTGATNGSFTGEVYTIDRTGPVITIVVPQSAPSYVLGSVVYADYTCTDSSGVASCVGTVADGAQIDTSSLGSKTFTVNATDTLGNTSSLTRTYTVAYGMCYLYDTTKSHKKGSTIPIKLYLCDATGNNLSSPGTVLNATNVVRVDGSASPVTADDSGNANPDANFRYDAGLGVGGGYIFNLSTKTQGYNTGTWKVVFTVNSVADASYFASFDIR